MTEKRPAGFRREACDSPATHCASTSPGAPAPSAERTDSGGPAGAESPSQLRAKPVSPGAESGPESAAAPSGSEAAPPRTRADTASAARPEEAPPASTAAPDAAAPPPKQPHRRPFFSEDPVGALDAHPVGREVRRLLMVVLASCIFALNLKTFVRTGNLIPGGVNGITLLTQQITSRFWGFEPPFSLLSWTLNAVPIYLGFRFIGKKFTFYSLIAVFLTGGLTDLFPALPVTSDPLLISIFGGIVNGAAASLCLFADATSGGTDIVSMYLSKIHGYDAWNIILAGNVVVLIVAGLLLGWDRALYSIIYQFTTTQVLHFLHRRYQKHTLLIITERPDEVYREIHAITHHNATRFRGEGCYRGAPRTLLYSVVSSEEVKKVIRQVRAIDPDAFINSIRTENISGRFYQRPSD